MRTPKLKDPISEDPQSSESQFKENHPALDLPINPEVTPVTGRRRFTAEYKLRILNTLDRCASGSERGELLRKEGIFSSSVSDWRKARNSGALSALHRIPGSKPREPQQTQWSVLEKENADLRARLEQAEAIIDVQKKVSQMFGLMNPKSQSSENKS